MNRLTLILMLLAGLTISSLEAGAKPPSHPIPRGSFIQWYLVREWTDARWQAEFRSMRELGMNILLFAPAIESKPKLALYPTKLPGYHMPEGTDDLIETVLRNAKKANFTVFLGLNLHDDWWQKPLTDTAWLNAQMKEGNQVADELYERYKKRYPKTFTGWYWVWEIDNYRVRTEADAKNLGAAININARHLKTLDPSMPIMLCPFMNYRLGTPAAYRKTWETIFANCSLGKGDIFAPQDCIGAGGLKLENFESWIAELQKAVKTKPGLRYWIDTETFDGTDWSSAPISRIVKQVTTLQPYVEQFITFAYNHYQSPGNVNPGYQKAWLEYVKTGSLPRVTPPLPVKFTGKRLPNGDVELSWSRVSGHYGSCGYELYRNGTRFQRIEPPKTDLEGNLTFVDKAPTGDNPLYSIKSYDPAGNKSEGIEVRVR